MKQIARRLRKSQTDAERLLWRHLRNRQIAGFKFRRQHVIKPYIVDFFCDEPKVIIEVDGGQHADRVESDEIRSVHLQKLGITVLRFWNNEVIHNLSGVLQRIEEELISSPHPNPLPKGEGRKRI